MKKETSKFTKVEILYDDPQNGFVIAKGVWDNQKETIGARWYEEDGIGYPQTYGKPQWFIFPDNIGRIVEVVLSIPNTIKNLV